MYNKVFRGERQYEVEVGSLLVLKYYITEKVVSPCEKYYGVEINGQQIKQGIRDSMENSNLFLSECKEWVEALLDKFIGNGVTPATMTYIIDDIVEIPY